MKNIKNILIMMTLAYASSVLAETTTITTTINPSTPTNPASVQSFTTTITTEPVVKDSDAAIISSIYDSYARDAAMIGTTVNVASKNGSVILKGNVTMQSQADQAVLLAKKIPGVKDVTSSIIVTTNARLGPTPKLVNY